MVEPINDMANLVTFYVNKETLKINSNKTLLIWPTEMYIYQTEAISA